jgi:mRNA interferase RelE/StbE
MSYKVFLERRAQKQLEMVDSNISSALKEKLSKLKSGFSPELDIKKLKGIKSLPFKSREV